MYICQLPAREQYFYYLAIKRKLIGGNCYTYRNLLEAMSSRITDLEDLLQGK